MVVGRQSFGLLALCLLMLTSSLAAVEARIDRNPVRVNETFELIINMQSPPVEAPDLSQMPEALAVIRSNNFYRQSAINGRTSIDAGWSFTIKASKQGIFTIPAIMLDGESTQALQIKVLPAVNSTDINGQNDAIRLEAELNTDVVYVQQQLIYTIRLYRAVRAQYASLTEPELEGALIELIGDDIQYETIIDNVPYRVLQRKYAIFPQKSGEFTIKGITYSAEVSSGTRTFSTLGSLQSRNRSISLSTEDQTITVKPIPNGVTDWWLPASNLRLEQSWTPDSSTLELGTPVTWTYSLVADGLTATQLPDILPKEIEGLKYYPEKPEAQNLLQEQTLVGKRTQRIAVIPTKNGTLTLPEIQIPWWDTERDEARVLTLAGRTLTIDGTPEVPVQTTASESPNASEVNTAGANPVTGDSSENQVNAHQSASIQLLIWQLATGTAVTLWLITLIWSIRKRNKTKQLAPHTSAKTRRTDKELTLGDLKRSLKSATATEAQALLVKYCRQQDPKLRSLGHLIKLSENRPNLNAQLQALDKVLYSNTGETNDWQARALVDQLGQLDEALNASPETNAEPQGLPPLHPN